MQTIMNASEWKRPLKVSKSNTLLKAGMRGKLNPVAQGCLQSLFTLPQLFIPNVLHPPSDCSPLLNSAAQPVSLVLRTFFLFLIFCIFWGLKNVFALREDMPQNFFNASSISFLFYLDLCWLTFSDRLEDWKITFQLDCDYCCLKSFNMIFNYIFFHFYTIRAFYPCTRGSTAFICHFKVF